MWLHATRLSDKRIYCSLHHTLTEVNVISVWGAAHKLIALQIELDSVTCQTLFQLIKRAKYFFVKNTCQITFQLSKRMHNFAWISFLHQHAMWQFLTSQQVQMPEPIKQLFPPFTHIDFHHSLKKEIDKVRIGGWAHNFEATEFWNNLDKFCKRAVFYMLSYITGQRPEEETLRVYLNK